MTPSTGTSQGAGNSRPISQTKGKSPRLKRERAVREKAVGPDAPRAAAAEPRMRLHAASRTTRTKAALRPPKSQPPAVRQR
jgi:hypothetical protein